MEQQNGSISTVLKRGDRVSGTITDILPSGVLVRLDDSNRVGRVRTRELFQDRQKARDFRNHVKKGESLDMVVQDATGKGVHLSVDLSVRLRENNPWEDIDREELEGQPVIAEILAQTHPKAYGELDSRVQVEIDLVTLREYLQGEVRNPEMDYELVVGDRVQGLVAEFNDEREVIILDIPAYLSQMTDRYQTEITQSSEPPKPVEQQETRESTPIPTSPLNILVADDNHEINVQMAGLLSDLGYTVEGAENIEAVRRLCDSHKEQGVPLGIAFIDINFPEWEDGFKAAWIVQDEFPDCRIYFITAMVADGLRREAPDDIQFHDILFQPISIRELEDALSAEHSPMSWCQFVEQRWLIPSGFQRYTAFVTPGEEDEDATARMEQILEKAVHDIGAERGAIFAMELEAYNCKIVASSGISLVEFEEAHERGILRYSPIRDVTMDRELIYDNECRSRGHLGKHNNLIRAIGEYNTCLAAPLSAPGEYSYALFLFDAAEGEFTQDDLAKAKQASLELAPSLQTSLFVEKRGQEQGFLLTGQLGAAMAHDLNKMLAVVTSSASRIEMRFNRPQMDEQTQAETLQIFRRHQAGIDQAINILGDYLSLVGQEQVEQDLDLNEVIQRSIERTRSLAQSYEDFVVNIEYTPPEELPKLKGYALRLERVFLNLLANALEQSELFIGTAAKITVQAEWVAEADKIRVAVSDTGPGIRSTHQKRIFEPLFSTKLVGFGLGLPIAQQIISVHFGGTLKLKETVRLIGSTFEITLPLSAEDSNQNNAEVQANVA